MKESFAIAICLFVFVLWPGCSDSNSVLSGPDLFEDNGDGTVTETVTGLVWLKDATCLGIQNDLDAPVSVAALSDGQCGLTDGSLPGDWRIPTLECPSGYPCSLAVATGEFASVFAPACGEPHIVDTTGTGCWSEGDPFTGVQPDIYRSSSTLPAPDPKVFLNLAGAGSVERASGGFCRTWPVRD